MAESKVKDAVNEDALLEQQRLDAATQTSTEGLRVRNLEDIERGAKIGTEVPVGAPSTEPAKTHDELYPNRRPELTSDNVMYTIPLPYGQVPVGPPILPNASKEVIDNMGVRLPPLPDDVDPRTVFLVGGKYVNFEGVPIDQAKVKPAIERVAEQEAVIRDLQAQISSMTQQKNDKGN